MTTPWVLADPTTNAFLSWCLLFGAETHTVHCLQPWQGELVNKTWCVGANCAFETYWHILHAVLQHCQVSWMLCRQRWSRLHWKMPSWSSKTTFMVRSIHSRAVYQTAQRPKTINKKHIQITHSACCILPYKYMTKQVFFVGPQHACRLISILMAHRDCSKACQDDKELYHNADCHFCLCRH